MIGELAYDYDHPYNQRQRELALRRDQRLKAAQSQLLYWRSSINAQWHAMNKADDFDVEIIPHEIVAKYQAEESKKRRKRSTSSRGHNRKVHLKRTIDDDEDFH